MVVAAGPGVRQMSTVIKFYFNCDAADARSDLRVFDFYKFSTPHLNSQSVGLELSLGARVVNPPRDHSLSAQIIHGQHFIISYNNNLLL